MANNKNLKFSIKTPKDHLPADDEKIEIDTDEGVIVVQKMKLPASFVIGGLAEKDMVAALVKHNADEKTLEKIGKLNALGEDSPFQQFIEIWQKASGIDVGESSASSE